MAKDEKFEAAKKRLAEKLQRNKEAAEAKEAQDKKIMKARIMPVGKQNIKKKKPEE